MGSPHPFDDDLDDVMPRRPRNGCLPIDLLLVAAAAVVAAAAFAFTGHT